MSKCFEKDGKILKHCNQCNTIKEISEFHKHRGMSDNLECFCKICTRININKYNKLNPDKKRLSNKLAKEKYNQRHPGRASELAKKLRSTQEYKNKRKLPRISKQGEIDRKNKWKICKNPKCERASQKLPLNEFSMDKRDGRYQRYCKKCNQILYHSIEYAKERVRIYSKHRRNTDINYKLLVSIRNTMTRLVNNNNYIKSTHTLELLGLSCYEYRKYLESKFQPSMNWNNYGKENDKWSIDHITPCELFDLSKESHQRACFNYSNTSPLMHQDNVIKQDRIKDGRRARELTREEKDEYLKNNGFAYLFK